LKNEKYGDLEIYVRSNSRSFKIIKTGSLPFDSLQYGFLLASHSEKMKMHQ